MSKSWIVGSINPTLTNRGLSEVETRQRRYILCWEAPKHLLIGNSQFSILNSQLN
jgi:hypothetical protein